MSARNDLKKRIRARKAKTSQRTPSGRQRSGKEPFAKLTRSTLEKWAGSRIFDRGQAYQNRGLVQGLVQDSEGKLLAWVQGSSRYATRVALRGRNTLVSDCTCPYWDTCKHAVAVVLEYLQKVRSGEAIANADRRDPRHARLDAPSAVTDFDDDDYYENDYDYDEDEDEDDEYDADAGIKRQSSRLTTRKRNSHAGEDLHAWLQKHKKAELVDLIEELTREHPTLQRSLRDRFTLSTADSTGMLRAARAEIAALDDIEYDRRGWGEGSADTGRIRTHLRALIESGHVDLAIRLGPDLLAGGSRLVENEEEGYSSYDLGACIKLLFDALPKSTLSPGDQLVWATEMELDDEYSLCDEGASAMEKRRFSKKAWGTLADHLSRRLADQPTPRDEDDYYVRYRREVIRDRLTHALAEAGRNDEGQALLENDAVNRDEYQALVDHLIRQKEWEAAENWCVKGIDALLSADNNSPHRRSSRLDSSVSGLRSSLGTICTQTGDHARRAALLADDFFSHPSLLSYQDLCKAAGRVRKKAIVRTWALYYVETGKRPPSGARRGRKPRSEPDKPWPLPETNVPSAPPSKPPQAPMERLLLDIAMAEKKPQEVLRWLERLEKRSVGLTDRTEIEVAAALKRTYPERSVAIWKRLAEAQIAQTQVRAYEVAGRYLRQARAVMTGPKKKDWEAYLAELREDNRRKPRCVEVIDRIARGNRRIVNE